ncbi:MAG: chitinase, partial [Clostridiales bacterium]|nr:chitinase [Clostridiales bacterium]
ILQDEKTQLNAKLLDGYYYFDFATVQDYFNDRFYVDYNEGLLLYTTPTDIIRAQFGTSEYLADGQTYTEDYTIAFKEGDVVYVAADYVKKYANFSYEGFTEPNRLQVYTSWGTVNVATIEKDTAVRYQGGVKSPILEDVSAGDVVIILEQMEQWSKVKTAHAIIGYVENKRLSEIREEVQTPVTDYVEPVYTNISSEQKINLGWHQVAGIAGNDTLDSVLANTKALNTISPTWFYMSDNDGNIVSLASQSYVDKCHEKGIAVWALLENMTYDMSTQEVLSYTSKRAYLINNLMTEVLAYGIDGINVDLEQIASETGEDFIEFIRELSIECRKKGIVLSVDNYVPKEYSAHYHRKEQGIVADYVIIMGYDEHYSGSEVAGSVASIDFVEEGIARTIEEVPAEKVINGIPFYTRIWETTGGVVSNEDVGMATAETFLSNHDVVPAWDETTCQNYGEFQSGDSLFQVWLEDKTSIEVKLNIMNKYQIAGVAAWKLGLEKADVWDVIEAYVQN